MPEPDYGESIAKQADGSWSQLISRWADRVSIKQDELSWWNLLLAAVLLLIAIAEFVFGDWYAPVVEIVVSIIMILIVLVRPRSRFRAFGAGLWLGITYIVILLASAGWENLTSDDVGFGSIGLSITVLAYGVFRWSSARLGVLAFLLVTGTSILGELALNGGPLIEPLLSRPVSWGLVAAVAVAMRYRARLAEQKVAQVRLQERQELARELHDVVAHHVSAIAIQAQAAQAVGSTNPEAVETSLKAIEETASHTLTEMRRMVGILRSEGDSAPLVGALSLADLAAAPGRPPVELVGDPLPDDLPIAVRAAATRIVQESITNARRHGGQGEPISVDVTVNAQTLGLRITNQTRNTSQSSGGFGLIGMAERVDALRGEFRAGHLPGGRWQVNASIPTTAKEADR